MYDEAKSELQKAAALGSSTALVNLGNIAMLQRDYEQAKQMYQQALELNPDSQGAISGLNRALAELLQ
jgi:tetratricopeptide (TPR) repeat protein